MKRKKYLATDASGRVHTRSTVNRTYTHCVVVYFDGGTFANGMPYLPWAKSFWCGRRDLAENIARRHRSASFSHVIKVEVLEVQQ